MDRDITKLKRHILLTRLALSLLIAFGLNFLILYFNPEWALCPAGQNGDYQGQSLWLVTGILFSAAGIAGLFYINRWKRLLLWTYRHEQPLEMRLTLSMEEDSESTSYFAILESPTGLPLRWRVQLLLSPSRTPNSPLPKAVWCQVYFHPRLGRPMVIRTENSLLWTMGGSGAAQKLR